MTMIPDKIYVPQHNIETGTIQGLCELIVEGSVEYIRKDSLLEWVRLAYGKLSMNPLDVQDVFEELIDKIK